MGLLSARTRLGVTIPGMCRGHRPVGIVLWVLPSPVPAAKVGTRVPAAEGEWWGPDLPVH